MAWRVCVIVCISLVLTGCRGSSETTGPEGQYQSVREIVDRLEGAGIACAGLDVRDAEEIAQEREAQPELSLPPGAQRIQAPEYAIAEAGWCQIEGGPEVAGEVLATTITVYEDDEHLESIPEKGIPGLSIVYGDNWEVNLSDLDLADQVAAALDGDVVPPLPVSEDDVDVEGLPGRCFFLAALPPGLEAAAAEFGRAADEPHEYAALLADTAYYMPEETRREMERGCLRGFELEEMVRKDAPALGGRAFEAFWFDACAHAQSNFQIRDQLGFVDGYSFTGFGKRLTNRVLGSTGLSAAEVARLRKVCARGIEEGLIGGPE